MQTLWLVTAVITLIIWILVTSAHDQSPPHLFERGLGVGLLGLSVAAVFSTFVFSIPILTLGLIAGLTATRRALTTRASRIGYTAVLSGAIALGLTAALFAYGWVATFFNDHPRVELSRFELLISSAGYDRKRVGDVLILCEDNVFTVSLANEFALGLFHASRFKSIRVRSDLPVRLPRSTANFITVVAFGHNAAVEARRHSQNAGVLVVVDETTWPRVASDCLAQLNGVARATLHVMPDGSRPDMWNEGVYVQYDYPKLVELVKKGTL